MIFSHRPNSSRTRRPAATISVLLVATIASCFALADDKSSGHDIDKAVIELFLESSIRKPAGEATPDERAAAIKQLEDIYNITSLDRAKELAIEPRTKAQLEIQGRVALFQRFAADYLARNPASEQELLNEYAKQTTLAPEKEYKARHILVKTQSEAIEIIAQLQSGSDFAELAKSKSTGPSGSMGGDLGWFGAQGMVKPFSDAVIALQDGAFTDSPVQTQFGWHVILREDTRDTTPPPLESVRDVLKQQVEQEKFQKFIDSLRE
jgi:peptidyl-prolyl cis-trans isomerase C